VKKTQRIYVKSWSFLVGHFRARRWHPPVTRSFLNPRRDLAWKLRRAQTSSDESRFQPSLHGLKIQKDMKDIKDMKDMKDMEKHVM